MKTETCDSCGKACSAEQLIKFDGQSLCPACLESATILCARCGTRIWKDENAGDRQTPLCQHCYDALYLTCVRCGRITHQDEACYEDDDEPLCDSCHTQYHSERGINDYYYKPAPVSHGSGPRFFDVELEIDGAGEDASSAEKLLDIANDRGDLLYCKYDGSLDDGFELVTHPMSPEFHMRNMPWAEIPRKAIEMGYTSHQVGTCGLHVHVNWMPSAP